MKQMKMLLVILGVLMFMFGTVSIAAAVPVTATLTADNHYALYYGNAGGVNFVGNNESDWYGDPGEYNWSEAETWRNFDVASGDYIYIAAWGDDRVAQGLIGQLNFGSGPLLTTNTDDWQVLLTSTALGDGSSPPSASDIAGFEIARTWNSITNSVAHGSGPWGYIDGISQDAQWIWGSDLLTIPETEAPAYQIFRTEVPAAPVPEPATILLLGAGLIGLAGFGRKKFKKRYNMA